MELYYKRVESVRKGRVHPARTQTVVIFLPDVRSCLPTRLEWDELSLKYKKHLEAKLQSPNESEDRELASADRVEKKSHATSSSSGGRDECITPINDGGDRDEDDDMDHGSNRKAEKSAAAERKNQKADAISTDAASGTPISTDISKALHNKISFLNNIKLFSLFYLFRCSAFSLSALPPFRLKPVLNCVCVFLSFGIQGIMLHS